jgi:DNA-binding NarL/FixJ family response regulator
LARRGPIRVALAVENDLILSGVRSALAPVPNIALVGKTRDSATLMNLIETTQPQVLVVGSYFGATAGWDFVAQILFQHPDVRVLVLGAANDDNALRGMLAAGALGYLTLDAAPKVVVAAVRAVARGDTSLARWCKHGSRCWWLKPNRLLRR